MEDATPNADGATLITHHREDLTGASEYSLEPDAIFSTMTVRPPALDGGAGDDLCPMKTISEDDGVRYRAITCLLWLNAVRMRMGYCRLMRMFFQPQVVQCFCRVTLEANFSGRS